MVDGIGGGEFCVAVRERMIRGKNGGREGLAERMDRRNGGMHSRRVRMEKRRKRREGMKRRRK